MSAFAKALLDQHRSPETEVLFHYLNMSGHQEVGHCSAFLHVRAEEEELIEMSLENLSVPRVLDIGCGLGPHSRFVRSLNGEARLTLVESDEDLLAFCLDSLPGAVGYLDLDKIPVDSEYDLIFMLGGGLGIFGDEEATRTGLSRVYRLLAKGGTALWESGHLIQTAFDVVRLQIQYNGETDAPFSWGHAGVDWMEKELKEQGFQSVCMTRSTQGVPFYIAAAKK